MLNRSFFLGVLIVLVLSIMPTLGLVEYYTRADAQAPQSVHFQVTFKSDKMESVDDQVNAYLQTFPPECLVDIDNTVVLDEWSWFYATVERRC